MKAQGHITNRMLPLLNLNTTSAVNERYKAKSQRPIAAFSYEDSWMQPGKGGA